MSSDCCCSEGSGCATASQRLWLALAGLVALVNAKSTSVCVSYPGDSPQGLCPVFKEAFRSKKEEEERKKKEARAADTESGQHFKCFLLLTMRSIHIMINRAIGSLVSIGLNSSFTYI